MLYFLTIVHLLVDSIFHHKICS